MICNIITADKANRLFWLGRYAERVYISLHLLRRYYDKVLDGDISNLMEYYQLLNVRCNEHPIDSKEFQLSQLYDRNNVCSIIAILRNANDNGIMLRQDITSESLSYIQMSLSIIDECAARKEKNITALQPITDYMLAFFGSVDERVFDKYTRMCIKVGKLVENLDLHIRFNYPFFRIEEAYEMLKEYSKYDSSLFDPISIAALDELMSEKSYQEQPERYKIKVINYLNCLVRL